MDMLKLSLAVNLFKIRIYDKTWQLTVRNFQLAADSC